MNLALSTAREAQTLLRRYLPVARLIATPALCAKTGGDVYLKVESDLPPASFKPRGALYALSPNPARRPIHEVTASSTGNHGAAVAFAAKLFGIQATIFLPANPNPVKRARIAALGAKIVEEGAADLSAAFEQAAACSRTQGFYFLNDATDPDLPAGPATIALEIFEQLPSVDTIVVPMGDTALIRGVAATAKHLSPTVRIIGVQAEQAPPTSSPGSTAKPSPPKHATPSPTVSRRASPNPITCARSANSSTKSFSSLTTRCSPRFVILPWTSTSSPSPLVPPPPPLCFMQNSNAAATRSSWSPAPISAPKCCALQSVARIRFRYKPRRRQMSEFTYLFRGREISASRSKLSRIVQHGAAKTEAEDPLRSCLGRPVARVDASAIRRMREDGGSWSASARPTRLARARATWRNAGQGRPR